MPKYVYDSKLDANVYKKKLKIIYDKINNLIEKF